MTDLNPPTELRSPTPETTLDHPTGRFASFLVRAIPLAVILLVAAELRLLFRTGMVHLDSLVYAHLARNVADGVLTLRYDTVPLWATVRAGLYGPVAALYALFGTSTVTTFAWPFACSILGVACAYAIGRRLAGESAGLLAAFLWAVLPTNVAAATALLGDGPIAALSMAVVLFLLIAESSVGRRRWVALGASVACLVLGILNKPAIALMLAFFPVYFIWSRRSYRLASIGLAGAFAAFVAAHVYHAANAYYAFNARPEQGLQAVTIRLRILRWSVGRAWQDLGTTWAPAATLSEIAGTATDWWSQVVLGPEFSWIAPLWIVAAAALLLFRRRQAYIPLLWCGSMFLYLELGSRSLLSYEPMSVVTMGFVTNRHFLLIAAPAMIATAIYLAQGVTQGTARWLLPGVAGAIGAVAWIGTRQATNLDWTITGETVLPFATVSALATAAVIFGAVVSPLATSGAATKRKTLAIAMLSLAIGLASLNLSYRTTASFQVPWLTTFPDAVRFLEADPATPILVQHDVFGQRLDYMSNFRLGFKSVLRDPGTRARIQVGPEDPAAVHDAYILIDEYYVRVSRENYWSDGPAYFRTPPANWAEVARFGDRDGARLRIYRAFGGDAVQQLEASRSAVRGSRNAHTLRGLLAAATGAGEYCEAVAAWDALRQTDPSSAKGLDLLPQIRECAARRPDLRGPNLFKNADFSQGLTEWFMHPDTDAIRSVDPDGPTDRAFHAKYRKGNWQVIIQEVHLKPDTIYVYEADVKTTTSVVSLYWQSDTGRHLDLASTYPDWTHLRYVFLTPRWDGPFPASVNPVLMNGPGEAWLKNLRISEFRVPPVQ